MATRALTLDDVRNIPTVVGIAAGREKVDGLRAALRGRLIDVLVCDAAAARGVLNADGAGVTNGLGRQGERRPTAHVATDRSAS